MIEQRPQRLDPGGIGLVGVPARPRPTRRPGARRHLDRLLAADGQNPAHARRGRLVHHLLRRPRRSRRGGRGCRSRARSAGTAARGWRTRVPARSRPSAARSQPTAPGSPTASSICADGGGDVGMQQHRQRAHGVGQRVQGLVQPRRRRRPGRSWRAPTAAAPRRSGWPRRTSRQISSSAPVRSISAMPRGHRLVHGLERVAARRARRRRGSARASRSRARPGCRDRWPARPRSGGRAPPR